MCRAAHCMFHGRTLNVPRGTLAEWGRKRVGRGGNGAERDGCGCRMGGVFRAPVLVFAEQQRADGADEAAAPAEDADAQLELLEPDVARVALQAAPHPRQRLVEAAEVLAGE